MYLMRKWADYLRKLNTNIIFKFIFTVYIFIQISYANAVPLSKVEKEEFIKGSVNHCIAKNNNGRKLTYNEKKGVENYCNCHATIMAEISLKEEMSDVIKGRPSQSYKNKIAKAREECINKLSK